MTFPRNATDAGLGPSCVTDNSLALEFNAMAFALNAMAFSFVDPERIPASEPPGAPGHRRDMIDEKKGDE
jgi:hypothetical protein